MAEKVFFTSPVSDTIPLAEMIGKEELLYYANVGVFCEKYLVTNQFKNLLATLNNGERMVVLKGPKGVGKSATLGALTAVSQLPTFLCGVKCSEGRIWQRYLRNLTNQSSPTTKKPHLDPGEFHSCVPLCTLALAEELSRLHEASDTQAFC